MTKNYRINNKKAKNLKFKIYKILNDFNKLIISSFKMNYKIKENLLKVHKLIKNIK